MLGELGPIFAAHGISQTVYDTFAALADTALHRIFRAGQVSQTSCWPFV